MRSSNGHTPVLSRRGFLAGTATLAVGAGLAALTGSSLGLTGCSRSSGDEELDILTVDDTQVTTLDAFSNIEDPSERYRLETVAELGAGAQVFGTGTRVCAAFCTGETSSPLSTVSLIKLEDGETKTVLDRGVGYENGFEIYAVRASDELMAWVESNYLTSDWNVYVAKIDADTMSVGEAILVDSGDIQYDAPELAVIGSSAYWIVQPAEDGDKTDEDSLLKASGAGSAPAVIHTSRGRFCGGLYTSGEVLVAMPRVDTSGVYYQLTAFQNGTGAIIATQVMPRSFRPACATYVNGGFSFAIAAGYDYGGGISHVGTYYQIGESEWLRLIRQPVTPLGYCNEWLFCKSGSRTVFINVKDRTYYTVDAPDSSADYGDYPICTGEVDTVYNFASVTKNVNGAAETKVVLRSIYPMSDKEIEEERQRKKEEEEARKAQEEYERAVAEYQRQQELAEVQRLQEELNAQNGIITDTTGM